MDTTTQPRPIRFTLGDDDVTYPGCDLGREWNGFSVVAIDTATRDTIVADIEALVPGAADDLRELTPDDQGRIDLDGYVTVIIRRCANCDLPLEADEPTAAQADGSIVHPDCYVPEQLPSAEGGTEAFLIAPPNARNVTPRGH